MVIRCCLICRGLFNNYPSPDAIQCKAIIDCTSFEITSLLCTIKNTCRDLVVFRQKQSVIGTRRFLQLREWDVCAARWPCPFFVQISCRKVRPSALIIYKITTNCDLISLQFFMRQYTSGSTSTQSRQFSLEIYPISLQNYTISPFRV